MLITYYQNPIGFLLAPGTGKTRIRKKCQKIKNCMFYQKIAQIRDVKMLKTNHGQ